MLAPLKWSCESHHVDNQLEIAIADNGSGFDVMTVQCGNGLANLRERLEGLGGRCDIESQPGEWAQRLG